MRQNNQQNRVQQLANSYETNVGQVSTGGTNTARLSGSSVNSSAQKRKIVNISSNKQVRNSNLTSGRGSTPNISINRSNYIDPRISQLECFLENDVEDILDLAVDSYQDINLAPLVVTAQVDKIWNFCVGYAVIALGRRADLSLTVVVGSSPQVQTEVSLYWFAAVTIFYNIWQCSRGEIPILQAVTREFKDLMNAATPVNSNNKAFVVNWNGDIADIINTLPYNSFQNPYITVAPYETSPYCKGVGDTLAITTPHITVDQILEFGPGAFELVQRYFIGNDIDKRLVPYTTGGKYYQNCSMFSVVRDPGENSPIQGVHQVFNEVNIPASDYWLLQLGWYSSSDYNREGWFSRTVQVGTHGTLMRLLKGAETTPNKFAHHMVDAGAGSASTLANIISAEMNFDEHATLMDVTGGKIDPPNTTPIYDFGFLSQLSPGQYLSWYVATFSRRFWLGAALCTGTPMPEAECNLIGAGSQFLTLSKVDLTLAPRDLTESYADLSSYISVIDKIAHISVPIIRGTKLTVDYDNFGGNNLNFIARTLVPEMNPGYPYLMQDTTGGLPATFTISSPALSVLTSGQLVNEAMEDMSATLDMLQGNLPISTANANRDGFKSRHLIITQYLNNDVDPEGYDITAIQTARALLAASEINPKSMDTMYSRFASLMYGTEEQIPAYQVIYNRPHRAQIDEMYLEWRAGPLIQAGHKRSVMPWGGDNTTLHDFHDCFFEEGGNIMSMITGKGGILHTGAELLAKGVLKYLGADRTPLAKSLEGKDPNDIVRMVHKGKLHPAFLSPVSYGHVSEDAYVKASHLAIDSYKSKQTQKNLTKKRTYVNKKRTPSIRGKRSKR